MNVKTKCEVKTVPLKDDGNFPNNPALPVLLYEGVLDFSGREGADQVEELFESHGWTGAWRNGVYPFHHYHSNTHEVLACYRGAATVQLGGPSGPSMKFSAGDVVVLPAGASHKRIDSTGDFAVVGAYPTAKGYDMCRGTPAEREKAEANIASTPVPKEDPIFGREGGLKEHWKSE